MNITRRQHYVWKHYLRAWEVNGFVSVVRKDGNVFRTNPDNIAVERDFYRLPVLSLEDEAFINRFIDLPGTSETLKEINKGWLRNFSAPSKLRRLLEEKSSLNGEIEEELSKVEMQSEEALHGAIERDTIRVLADLRNGRSSLWDDEDDAMTFSIFLSFQHLRTKKMQDQVVAGFSGPSEQEFAKRVWPILRHILATNLGWSIFSERKEWRIRILQTPDTISFITSDQPTQNLLASRSRNDLALFYPIDPCAAVILERVGNPSPVGRENNLSETVVSSLNARIFDYSYEQVFGTNLEYLKRLNT